VLIINLIIIIIIVVSTHKQLVVVVRPAQPEDKQANNYHSVMRLNPGELAIMHLSKKTVLTSS
jgi:hypothetical protein